MADEGSPTKEVDKTQSASNAEDDIPPIASVLSNLVSRGPESLPPTEDLLTRPSNPSTSSTKTRPLSLKLFAGKNDVPSIGNTPILSPSPTAVSYPPNTQSPSTPTVPEELNTSDGSEAKATPHLLETANRKFGENFAVVEKDATFEAQKLNTVKKSSPTADPVVPNSAPIHPLSTASSPTITKSAILDVDQLLQLSPTLQSSELENFIAPQEPIVVNVASRPGSSDAGMQDVDLSSSPKAHVRSSGTSSSSEDSTGKPSPWAKDPGADTQEPALGVLVPAPPSPTSPPSSPLEANWAVSSIPSEFRVGPLRDASERATLLSSDPDNTSGAGIRLYDDQRLEEEWAEIAAREKKLKREEEEKEEEEDGEWEGSSAAEAGDANKPGEFGAGLLKTKLKKARELPKAIIEFHRWAQDPINGTDPNIQAALAAIDAALDTTLGPSQDLIDQVLKLRNLVESHTKALGDMKKYLERQKTELKEVYEEKAMIKAELEEEKKKNRAQEEDTDFGEYAERIKELERELADTKKRQRLGDVESYEGQFKDNIESCEKELADTKKRAKKGAEEMISKKDCEKQTAEALKALQEETKEVQEKLDEYEDGDFMTADDCAQLTADQNRKHAEVIEDLENDKEILEREKAALQKKVTDLEREAKQEKRGRELISLEDCIAQNAASNSKKDNQIEKLQKDLETLKEENEKLKKRRNQKDDDKELCNEGDSESDLDDGAPKSSEDDDRKKESDDEEDDNSQKPISEPEDPTMISTTQCSIEKDYIRNTYKSEIEALKQRVEDLTKDPMAGSLTEEQCAEKNKQKIYELQEVLRTRNASILQLEGNINPLQEKCRRLTTDLEKRLGDKEEDKRSLRAQIADLGKRVGESSKEVAAQAKKLQEKGIATEQQQLAGLERQNTSLQDKVADLTARLRNACAKGGKGSSVGESSEGTGLEWLVAKIAEIRDVIENQNKSINDMNWRQPAADQINQAIWEAEMILRKMKKGQDKKNNNNKGRGKSEEKKKEKNKGDKERKKNAEMKQEETMAEAEANDSDESVKPTKLKAKRDIQRSKEREQLRRIMTAREADAENASQFDASQLVGNSGGDRTVGAFARQGIINQIWMVNNALVTLKAKRALDGVASDDAAAAVTEANIAIRMADKFEDQDLLAQAHLWAMIAYFYNQEGPAAESSLENVNKLAAKLKKEEDKVILSFWRGHQMDGSSVEKRMEGYYKGTQLARRDAKCGEEKKRLSGSSPKRKFKRSRKESPSEQQV